MLFITPIILITLYTFVSPNSFLNFKGTRVEIFNEGYGNYYAYGTVIKSLSSEDDTLFLEAGDDLIYWVSDQPSSYKYQMYTGIMPLIPRYFQEREEMFKNNPPDFYYDACLKKEIVKLSEEAENFTRLELNGKPSCLLVKNSKLKTISKEQIKSIKPLGFSLEPET